MIELETDQGMFTDPGYRVVIGGGFAPDEQVEVDMVSHPEQRVAFYALYVATGEMPA